MEPSKPSDDNKDSDALDLAENLARDPAEIRRTDAVAWVAILLLTLLTATGVVLIFVW
jgi:hypothetical protein